MSPRCLLNAIKLSHFSRKDAETQLICLFFLCALASLREIANAVRGPETINPASNLILWRGFYKIRDGI